MSFDPLRNLGKVTEEILDEKRNVAIMDLKGAWAAKPQGETAAYRPECYSCESYRVHTLGGMKIGGITEPRWHCVLMHERREPCRFERQDQSTAPTTRPTPQTLDSRLPLDPSGEPGSQPERARKDLPSPPTHNTPNPPKPEPPLPDMPKVEGPRSRSRVSKRRRR